MDPFGEANDNNDGFRSRRLYICDVVRALARSQLSFPTASQEKLYKDALRHVACLVSNQREGKIKEALRKRCSQKKRMRSRKEVLKEILSLLVCLRCERLYDPPGDDEIGFYLLIKRYIRSIIAFFGPPPPMGTGFGLAIFGCYGKIGRLHHMEELSELNQHLAHLAAFVSEADFRNGSSVTPLMGINEKIKAHPLIEGSKERSNAFYVRKFEHAKFDLRSTEFAHCPPSEEEKRLYVQILNDLRSASSVAIEEPNIFSDLLCNLFIERNEREIKDLERHSRIIKDLILDKLSLTKRYELIREQFMLKLKDYYNNYPYGQGAIDLRDFKRDLVQKCEVSAKEMTNYVRCVDQYQRIAVSVAVFLCSRVSDDRTLCVDVRDLLKFDYGRKEAGWQLLHSLSLLKQGRFSFGTVLQEHSIARISKKRACGESQQEAKWMQKCGIQKGKTGNLKILRGIVEDLRCIGASDIETDDEEEQLLYKIWQNVASCIHIFLSGIAYEQRHYISKCGGLPDGRIPGLRTTKRKRYTTSEEIINRLFELAYEMSDMSHILAALRDGLLEKTGKDKPHCGAI